MKPVKYMLLLLMVFLLPPILLGDTPIHDCSWIVHGVLTGTNTNGGAPVPIPNKPIRARSQFPGFPFGFPWYTDTTDANGRFSIQSPQWWHPDCHKIRNVRIEVPRWGNSDFGPVTTPSNGLFLALDGNNPDSVDPPSSGLGANLISILHFNLPFDAFYQFFGADGPPPDSPPPDFPPTIEDLVKPPRPESDEPKIVAEKVDDCRESHPMIPRPDFTLESISMGPRPNAAMEFRGIVLSFSVKNSGNLAYTFDGPCMSDTEAKMTFNYGSYQTTLHEVTIPLAPLAVNDIFQHVEEENLRGTNSSEPPQEWDQGYRFVQVTIEVDYDHSQEVWGRVRELSESNNIAEVCYDTNPYVQGLVPMSNCSGP